jgi:hypothetical protein
VIRPPAPEKSASVPTSGAGSGKQKAEAEG